MKHLGIRRDEVVRLRIRGLSLRQIAARLGCSQSAVRYDIWVDATRDDPESRCGGWWRHHAGRRPLPS